MGWPALTAVLPSQLLEAGRALLLPLRTSPGSGRAAVLPQRRALPVVRAARRTAGMPGERGKGRDMFPGCSRPRRGQFPPEVPLPSA